jgi:hypothetical protein
MHSRARAEQIELFNKSHGVHVTEKDLKIREKQSVFASVIASIMFAAAFVQRLLFRHVYLSLSHYCLFIICSV